ncbi:hypothetical protein [Lacticaseibacillus paracasei]|uniref:hypothetical protein n=1 Tax=Lacticaseibacillus paracasei TaxID=1597 RepID=UPI001899172B|nr:hypothetical protein [Lacticaseibacillus paracasei]
MKNSPEWAVASLAVTIFILLPVVAGLTLNRFGWESGSTDGWLGFWGGYTGGAVSIMFSLINTKYQLERANLSEQKQKMLEFLPYFNITPPILDSKKSSFSEAKTVAVWTMSVQFETLSNTSIHVTNMDVFLSTKKLPVLMKFPQGDCAPGSKRLELKQEFPKKMEFDDITKNYQIEIECQTIFGTHVLFTYGYDHNGVTFYAKNKHWIQYAGEDSQQAHTRLKLYPVPDDKMLLL